MLQYLAEHQGQVVSKKELAALAGRAYAGLGRMDLAVPLIEEHRAPRPFFSIARWNTLLPHLNPELTEQRLRIVQILRDLGVPEGPVQTGSVK